jgi:hypothetical protein
MRDFQDRQLLLSVLKEIIQDTFLAPLSHSPKVPLAGNGKIGLAEAVCAMQRKAGIR